MNLRKAIARTALALTALSALAACTQSGKSDAADRLNETAYQWRYRNLDSTMVYADRAYKLAADGDGQAEALNTKAFVETAKMQYDTAKATLSTVYDETDNQIELLIADIQNMRLCQRRSANKDFYTYWQKARARLSRIRKEADGLNRHNRQRLAYAESEYGIVASTYYYYVGLIDQSVNSLKQVEQSDELAQDTAQLLSYYYNVGAGGILQDADPEVVAQQEFDYLVRCYLLARQYKYPYWEANSLQSISEHLQNASTRQMLIAHNRQETDFINTDHMPDSLLAGNLAQRALDLFNQYGDVYQTAGAYRTLAECYWGIGDYESALICLNNALSKDAAVEFAPDLVASIREQLSLTYSALGDKANSDYNRNIYLDMQEVTRQDRELEARAEVLSESSRQLNIMISCVVLMILLTTGLLFWFDHLRRRNDRNLSLSDMLQPLEEWANDFKRKQQQDQERYDELLEETEIARQKLLAVKKYNIEQQAKVSLLLSIIPLINRMQHEVRHLLLRNEDDGVRSSRYEYVAQIAEKINDYNRVLTQWIQMRQGQLQLHIESFPISEVLDTMSKGRMEYRLKGIDLQTEPSTAVVKADKVLTLFMVNTICENAKRFTPSGGTISISAREVEGNCVEISIQDTGTGIAPDKMKTLFSHKITEGDGEKRSHGFGLMNCKGIIEKYKKISSIFSVCAIGAESELGRGSRFWFRLPLGIKRTLLLLLLFLTSLPQAMKAQSTAINDKLLVQASAFADSAYNSNVAGQYERTIAFADSCRQRLNAYYLKLQPKGTCLMTADGDNPQMAAELSWYRDSLRTNYDVILDIRNETAVAALALHRWALYTYNNKVYTQLFRECSADNSLPSYVKVMQRSENNKNIAIVLLFILFLSLFPAYYVLYYRHRVAFRMCYDKVAAINNLLRSNLPTAETYRQICALWNEDTSKESKYENISQLDQVVSKIKATLTEALAGESVANTQMTYAADSLHALQMKTDRVYVSNSVLDNCLSTLKHETMYYPSRIRQLIDGQDDNLDAVAELMGYYKELYTILCEQALRQIDDGRQVDYDLLVFLFDLLRQLGADTRNITEEPTEANYVTLSLPMQGVGVSQEQCQTLFTSETTDVKCLICRQILRNLGELTGQRACGIKATHDSEGTITIKIIITKTIWKSLKSLL